jgi:RNA polymerase subunit RPABC4/transcription elongation factor Spt4
MRSEKVASPSEPTLQAWQIAWLAASYPRVMELIVASQRVLCPICSSTSFARRYWSSFVQGASLARKALSLGKNSARVVRFYACERCSYVIAFAGDTPESPHVS